MQQGRLFMWIGLGLAAVTFFLVFTITRPEPEVVIPEVRVLVVGEGLTPVESPGEKVLGVIPAGTPLQKVLETEGALDFKPVQADQVPPGAVVIETIEKKENRVINSPFDLIPTYGNYITLIDLQTGNYVEEHMLTTSGGLQHGERAVALAIDQVTSVGGTVRPGNHVDVVVSYVKQTEEGDRVPVTETLLQDVTVLSVFGKQRYILFSESVTGAARYTDIDLSQEFTPEGAMLKDSVVTLALPPADALRLTYMSNFAQEVRLLVRPLEDQDTLELEPVEVEGITPGFLPPDMLPEFQP